MRTDPSITRAFTRVSGGQVHHAWAGHGPAVLLLHQTPRSWREYAAVLPLLADRQLLAIAMDTVGYGDSYGPDPGSIDAYASVALELLDALGLQTVHVVGHHTGGVIAIELAAAAPERVGRLVLSSTPLVDAAARRARADRPPIDEVEPADDGSHLLHLWAGRARVYPSDRPNLLTAFVRDALLADDPVAGHRAVGRYCMEERLPLVRATTLLLGAPEDPYAYPDLHRLSEHLADSRVVEVAGGMVPLPDQAPQAFATAVADFLEAGR